jgi:spermidine synthase
MSDPFEKNFYIHIQQKIYEKETSQGILAVYLTSPFGMLLTLNGFVLISEHDGFFYQEMITHPVLFTHPKPQTVAIIGNGFGILQEVLKHHSVTQIRCLSENPELDEMVSQYFSHLLSGSHAHAREDKQSRRVKHHAGESLAWLKQCDPGQFDIIIQAQASDDFLEEHYRCYFRVLKPDGILVQPCHASLLQLKNLIPIFQNIKHAGFTELQTLNFPQPSYPSGWRTVIMATKSLTFKRVREKDVFNRTFRTRYYNFDTHNAALAVPEFMREELI